MQRQFTIELRVDYADPDKNEEMRKAMRRAARHVLATARLLADNGVKPQAVLFSDDFFQGHQEIDMLEDELGEAIEKHDGQEEQVSDELLAAAKEMAENK